MMAPDDYSPCPDDPAEDAVPALYCIDGPTLCRLRLLSEAEWAALPAAERPARAEHVPGLGWVVGLPEQVLN